MRIQSTVTQEVDLMAISVQNWPPEAKEIVHFLISTRPHLYVALKRLIQNGEKGLAKRILVERIEQQQAAADAFAAEWDCTL